MIKLKLNGDNVIELETVDSNYVVKEDEIIIEELPPLTLVGNEVAYVYYRNGQIEYEIKRRD